MLNGHLQGYILEYKVVNSTDKGLSINLQETDNSYTLINLLVNTSYMITVAAFNSQGSGPASQPYIGFTFQNGKCIELSSNM